MKRDPVEITQDSASHIAKWRMREMMKEDKNMDALKRFAMTKAVEKGGGVDEIANMLYSMGIRLTLDRNNAEHQSWIAANVVALEK